MRTRGPLITLVAVGVFAAIVLVVSLVRTPAPEAVNAAATVPPLAIAETPPPTTTPPTTTPAPTREAVYTGLSSGEEVTVAVAVRGEKASAYICDG